MVNDLWENLLKKEQKEKDVCSLLAENHVFKTLSRREIRFASELVHMRDYRSGEVIFRQGAEGTGMFIIVKGQVDIVVEGPSSSAATSGEEKISFVTKLDPGDFFGEISLLEPNSRRTATAVAATDLRAIGFFKPELTDILERNPVMGVKLLVQLSEILAKRLKETASKITELRLELKSMAHGHREL